MPSNTKAKLLRVVRRVACFLGAIGFLGAALGADEPAKRMSQAAHPQSDAAGEFAAIEAARAGVPLAPVPKSPRVAAAIERLRREPAPAREAFALIKVTDRKTGERVMVTRGVPLPSFDAYLVDPATAPAGWIYAEESSLGAENGVEVAIRSQVVVPSTVRPEEAGPVVTADEEEFQRLTDQYDGGPLPLRIDTDLRQALTARAGVAGMGDQPIRVTIELRDVPRVRIPKAPDLAAGGHLWAGLQLQAERERVIGERKLAMRSRQAPVEAAVRAAGGRVYYSSWLSGTVEAWLPPAAIVALAQHPAVLSIEKMVEHSVDAAAPHGGLVDVFDGIDIYDATNQAAFDGHEGNNSAGGHSYTSRLTIGQAEACIREDYPAWRNNTPTSSFRARFYDVDPVGHTLGSVENCWADGDGEKYEHGQWVASMMVADFMDGQEPALSTNSRRQRTGSCPECYLTFFQDQHLNNRIESLDRACEKGVDIFQSSVSSGDNISCNGSGSYDGTLQDLTEECGVLYVQSAGNNGSTSGDCTTSYPADHPWTLAIGGVLTDEPCNDDSDWFTSDCVFDPGSSRGGATYNGDSGRASVIDLAAPFRVTTLDPDVLTPSARLGITGTSFSSPIVAGLAGRVMDFWRIHADTSVFFANRMRTLMLLFGDRSTGSTGVDRTETDTSKYWGAGRVTLFPFDDREIWWLSRGSVYLKKKESYSFDLAIPSSTRMIKVVVWHDGKNYSNEPKIKLEVDPGGGCSEPNTVIEESDSKALQFRSVSGCSTVHVRIRNSPVGVSGSRRFHFALIATEATSERYW